MTQPYVIGVICVVQPTVEEGKEQLILHIVEQTMQDICSMRLSSRANKAHSVRYA